MLEGASALALVARTVWHDAGLRRLYLRVAAAQLVAIVALGTLASLAIGDDDDNDDDEPPRAEAAPPTRLAASGDETPGGGKSADKKRRRRDVIVNAGSVDIKDDDGQTVAIRQGRVDIKRGDKAIVIGPHGVEVRPAASSPGAAASAEAHDGASPAGASAAANDRAPAPSGEVGAAPPAARHGEKARHHDDDDDDDDDDDAAARAEQAKGPRVVWLGKRGRGGDHEGAAATGLQGFKARLQTFWGKIITIYGTFVAIAWCVVALSRDYHDAIGREASLRLGLPPEDPPIVPRVRLNVPWVVTRIKRRFRGFMLFTLGVPALWALSVFFVLPLMGVNYVWGAFDTSSAISRLYGLLAAAWGGYWLAVFTGAKTALAWVDERIAPEPWFLRAWGSLTERLPAAFAWLPRGYGRAWQRMSQRVFAPAICFERAPYEIGGLAAVRLLGSVPLFYPFVRPLTPIAAALLIARHAPPTSQPLRAPDAGPQGPAAQPGRDPVPLPLLPPRPLPRFARTNVQTALITSGAARGAFRSRSSPL